MGACFGGPLAMIMMTLSDGPLSETHPCRLRRGQGGSALQNTTMLPDLEPGQPTFLDLPRMGMWSTSQFKGPHPALQLVDGPHPSPHRLTADSARGKLR